MFEIIIEEIKKYFKKPITPEIIREGMADKMTYRKTLIKALDLTPIQAIYMPIPKVACSSLKAYFTQVLYPDMPSEEFCDIQSGAYFHRKNLLPTIQKNDISDSKYDTYTKFVFVRNPWDRIVSCYQDKINNDHRTDHLYIDGLSRDIWKLFPQFKPGMTFREFVSCIQYIPDEYADEHFRSQSSFVLNENDILLTDFIGKYENLEADFIELCHKIGIPASSMMHLNKNKKRKDYRTYYDEETKNLVAKRYKRDIELFAYTFRG